MATLIIALLVISFFGYWTVKILGVIGAIVVVLSIYVPWFYRPFVLEDPAWYERDLDIED